MRGVAELLNKGRLNARARARARGEKGSISPPRRSLHSVILQSRNGLLMHYSSANAAFVARVLPYRCCALTCPKVSGSATFGGEIARRRCQSAEGNLRVNTHAHARYYPDNYPIFFLRRTKIYITRVSRV